MRVHIDNPASDPVNVSGTVTSVGTQDVNVITSTPLDVTVTNALSDPVHVTPVKDNAITGVYVFSADEIPGVAAANNYLSVFNPIGSGKNLYLGGVFISAVTAGGTTVTAPMRGFRITTAAGGGLQAVSATAKFITAYPDSVAEVRTGNPTVTLGASLFNSPPPLSAGVGSTPVHQVPIPPNSAPFSLAPGEGIVLREATGDTDLRWNLSIAWAEANI